DMSLNTTPCVSCGRCAETCPTGALMPKPRVLEKYEVDESRCILCGICVDACPYDALRCGPDFELSHTSREEPLIDLLAISSIDRDTEVSWIRKERDWVERARDQGRMIDAGRMLPLLPPGVTAGNGHGVGDGHNHAGGNGHGPSGNGHAMLEIGDGPSRSQPPAG
ncbi:MAG: 4Fe-4S binding protein, partial [Candidatus Limnocylindrales bacterium]